jgi:nickel-dependent lactate racemase
MDIQLKYGKQQFSLSLPSRTIIPEYQEPEFSIDKTNFIKGLLHYLPEEKQRYTDVAIVISDKTRLCDYPKYLPWLTEILQQKGAQKENISFYIAYGTHPKQSDDESLNSYGEVFHQYRFVHHDCNDEKAFELCGTTKRGTPVTIRKDILNSTLLITFGAISHHYFAAYGGGRKLLFPGLAERKAIYHNHGLFLDHETQSLASNCQPGKLEGNPLAEDLKEIDTFSPPKISIHGILNASGKVCRLITGNNYNDFVKACNVHDSYYKYNSSELYNLVVASSGGYPKDINFIQAHKSVHHAAAFVKDGGTLIILSECIDGIGSNYFVKFLEAGSFKAAYAMLEKHYEGNGGTALSMMLKTKRIRICMLTSLDEATCRILGVEKITKEEAQNIIDKEQGGIALIKNASILVKNSL